MVVCPGCGKENGASFRFCMGCGAGMPRRPRGLQEDAPAALSADETASLERPPDSRRSERVTWTATVTPPVPSRLELISIAIDGSATASHRLNEGPTVFGKNRGGAFARDRFMSPNHGSFTPRGERLLVRDEDSLNGIYRKLRAGDPCPIASGQCFRVGQALLRFDALKAKAPDHEKVAWLGAATDNVAGRVLIVLGRNSTGDAFVVPMSGLQIGRERGDIVFPDDGYVSGAHCRLNVEAGRVVIIDLGSSNGTFVRLSGETEVGPGEVLLLGQQLFRVALASR